PSAKPLLKTTARSILPSLKASLIISGLSRLPTISKYSLAFILSLITAVTSSFEGSTTATLTFLTSVERALPEHLIHRSCSIVFLKPGRCIKGLYPAVDHYRNPVAICGLIHIVRRHKYSNTSVGHLVDQLPELPACIGVNTTSRLVKKHYSRIMKNRHRKGQLLLPPDRQFPDQGLSLRL